MGRIPHALVVWLLAAQQPARPFEHVLAGVEVGSPISAIERVHPGLYKHSPEALGATLWEGCNQGASQVFSFAEDSILCGYVAWVAMEEDDAHVCRDAASALPVLHVEAHTPRGVRLGASDTEVRATYGEPTEIQSIGAYRYLRYLNALRQHPSGATGILLVFTMRRDRVQRISLGLTGRIFNKPLPPDTQRCPN